MYTTKYVRDSHLPHPSSLGLVIVSTGLFPGQMHLNVVLNVAMFKTVIAHLLISLIHMNFLDIEPNALAQVSASTDEKRSRTLQAFVAPQRQSLEQD